MRTCEICKTSIDHRPNRSQTCGPVCAKAYRKQQTEIYLRGPKEPRLAMDEYFWSLVRPAPQAKERPCMKCRKKISKRTFNGELARICSDCKVVNSHYGLRAEMA